jgi:hypothetical protein
MKIVILRTHKRTKSSNSFSDPLFRTLTVAPSFVYFIYFLKVLKLWVIVIKKETSFHLIFLFRYN